MVLILLLACKNDKNVPTSADEATVAERLPDQGGVGGDTLYKIDAGALNVRNPRWYTYRYDETTTTESQVQRAANPSRDSMYEISERTRPPLYHENCLSAVNPEQCSNEAVIDWMQYAVERPRVPAALQNKLMHYVAFTVDEKGKADGIKIIAATQACTPCVAATEEAIAGMHSWIPALRDGKPVKVQVVLPVYYD